MEGTEALTINNNYDLIKTAIENKDLFSSIMFVFILLVVIMPLVYRILNRFEKNLEKLGENFITALKEHEQKEVGTLNEIISSLDNHKNESRKLITGVMMTIGNTVLNEEQAVDFMLSKMWFVSFGKLGFIKQVMINNHIEGRKEEIRSKIKQELASRSEEYMKSFRQFTTPVGDLGDWLDKNFSEKEFNIFIDKIIEIIYNKRLDDSKLNKEAIISIKVNEISTLMKELQNSLGAKLRKDIKKYI